MSVLKQIVSAMALTIFHAQLTQRWCERGANTRSNHSHNHSRLRRVQRVSFRSQSTRGTARALSLNHAIAWGIVGHRVGNAP
jgi:hypothetical protein